MADHGQIHWSELATKDVEGSKAFFSAQAGWAFEGMPMPDGTYWLAMVGGQPVAGMMDLAQIGDPNVPPNWMTYIAVDDIDKVVAEAEASGGKVVRPAFDVPGVGRIAMIQDPGGATVGMMTPAPASENPAG